jgi:phage baseplate assembly protein W
VTFVTTSSSGPLSPSGLPALVVQPSGLITTTGSLLPGTYTVSGTDSDSFGNTGTWTFTLTVAAPTSPQNAIVPVFAIPPTGIEILVPFQIDPATGGVAYLIDYVAILAQHIETVILTSPTERVMMPTYGSGLPNHVFGPIGSVQNAALAADIRKSVKNWEPAVKILSVQVGANQGLAQTTLQVTVKFSVVPFTDVNTITVTTGGTITQVQSL